MPKPPKQVVLLIVASLALSLPIPSIRAADESAAAVPAAPVAVAPAAAMPLTAVPSAATPAATVEAVVITNTPPPGITLEQFQEQQRVILHAIDQVRQEAEAAARRNSESMTGRLASIEQSLVTERARDLEAIHKWNLFTLLAVGGFASLGFLGLLLVAPFLVRAMNRMSDAASTLRVAEPGRLQLPSPEMMEQALLANPAVAQSTARFLEAMERMERRIHQLENTVQTPQLPANPSGNGNPSKAHVAFSERSGESENGATERGVTPRFRAELILEKGQAQLSLGRAEQALASFEEAIGLDPACAEAYVKRGRALEKLNRGDEALASYDQAVALEPSMSTAYLCKGALLNQLARYTEAVQCYELALRVQEQSRAASA